VALVVVFAATLFVAKDQLLLHVWTRGNPVTLVSPGKSIDEDQR